MYVLVISETLHSVISALHIRHQRVNKEFCLLGYAALYYVVSHPIFVFARGLTFAVPQGVIYPEVELFIATAENLKNIKISFWRTFGIYIISQSVSILCCMILGVHSQLFAVCITFDKGV